MKINFEDKSYMDDFYDEDIERTMKKEVNVPDNVIQAREKAFAKIGELEMKKNKKVILPAWAKGVAAAVICIVAFSGVKIANPVLASQIPVIGSLFKQLKGWTSFNGEYDGYAEKLTVIEPDTKTEAMFSETCNGVTVTLSEVYCNQSALYLSMMIESDEEFPEDLLKSENQVLDLPEGTIAFSFLENPDILYDYHIEGKCLDNNTFIGILRCGMLPYLGSGSLAEVPDNFDVTLSFDQISGLKLNGTIPEMPEDIHEVYEKGMEEQGLSTDPDEYAAFTDEEKEIQHRLYTEMWNAYTERFPDIDDYPNKYENWWYDGSWKFDFPVTLNEDNTVEKKINEESRCALGPVTVKKTPFELEVICDYEKAYDYFFVLFDAEGKMLERGQSGGINTYPIWDADTSKVTVYICDYIEYMDELKGYYYSDDYDEKSKEKTFQQLLEERSLYSEEIFF